MIKDPSPTPGPWMGGVERGHETEDGDSDLPAFVRSADGTVLALVFENYSLPGGSSYEANAKLMGAAPDLLAACRDAIEAIAYLQDEDDGGLISPARLSLQKAILKAIQ